VLPQQVQQRRLDRRDGVDRRAQVEGLQAAAAGVAVGELALHLGEDALLRAERLPDHERARVLQRLADLFAAGNLADARATGTVGQDQEIAREERAVRAAEVEQHAVASGDRDDAQLADDRGR
jgi:hypothetical protein